MKKILYILQKEFIQVFRNKTMLPMIFGVPIIQLVVLVHAATLEMKSIDLYIVDKDLSSLSTKLVNKFEGSPFYTISGRSFSIDQANKEIENNKADVILHIPNGFEHNLIRNNSSEIQLLIDGINGTAANLINAYSISVISDFNKNIIVDLTQMPKMAEMEPISIQTSFWYNPELNYKTYMLPGILVILVTIISLFMTAMNIVREKEMGTIEQINVTPIRKYEFIIGKLVPFMIIALFELAFGLTIGKIFFHIPIVGSVGLLFGFTLVYLLVVLSLGLFISTLASTQQQVMFISFFFMLVFILMSGIFTPTESMPLWAQRVNIINPFYYYMRVIRMILLKGSEFWDISREFFSLLIYGTIMLSLATWRYRKVA
ncbi:MAG: ABC transporter permease [Bacteroidetes bacterium GWF2_33_16]|nr:MAG: ABC transporter permease [Bacteroidetes bacterium GWE2_32_14]OFY02952.1 MAG: ABC transporter permease [Bacteroidetes bacterium GWF2_33_16]